MAPLEIMGLVSATFRAPSCLKAVDICCSASALSKGVTGISPQSRTVSGVPKGSNCARGLKPRKGSCLALAARMARGPKRAPIGVGSYVINVK